LLWMLATNLSQKSEIVEKALKFYKKDHGIQKN